MPRYVQSRSSAHMVKQLKSLRAENFQVFEYILDKEEQPSPRNAANVKPMKKRMAQTLLERRCKTYNYSPDGNTPLHLAASRTNSEKLVRRLLNEGAKVNQKNHQHQTPLHLAFKWADEKVIDLMLEHHLRNSFVNENNAHGITYLHIAASRPLLDNVIYLVEYGNAPVNCQIDLKCSNPCAGFTPLHMAVLYNQLEVAEVLLEYGAYLWMKDAQGSTPLHLALEMRNVNMIDLLLSYDDKKENYINDNGLSHFMATCVSSDPNYAVDYLLNPANSKTALIHERVDKYDDLDYPFKEYTPLHFAGEFGRQKIVQLLLTNGARIQTRDTDGPVTDDLEVLNEFHRAADLFVLRCLRHEWSPAITNSEYKEDKVEKVERVERVEMITKSISDEEDSGYCEDVGNESDGYECSLDFSDKLYSDSEGDLDFWEDDIKDYVYDD